MNTLKKTEREKYINKEEFIALLKAAKKDSRSYMLFFLAGNLGMRIGEAVRLRKLDISFKEKYISVPTLKREGKKGVNLGSIQVGNLPKTYVDVPVGDNILEKIQEFIKLNNIKKWLFAEKSGAHIPEWKAKRLFKRYARKAKLNAAYSVHSLRHYKGIEVYKKFKDIRAVQLVLRHRNINSSVVYTTMDMEAKRNITEQLEVVE